MTFINNTSGSLFDVTSAHEALLRRVLARCGPDTHHAFILRCLGAAVELYKASPAVWGIQRTFARIELKKVTAFVGAGEYDAWVEPEIDRQCDLSVILDADHRPHIQCLAMLQTAPYALRRCDPFELAVEVGLHIIAVARNVAFATQFPPSMPISFRDLVWSGLGQLPGVNYFTVASALAETMERNDQDTWLRNCVDPELSDDYVAWVELNFMHAGQWFENQPRRLRDDGLEADRMTTEYLLAIGGDVTEEGFGRCIVELFDSYGEE
jgi:hypothetical protein